MEHKDPGRLAPVLAMALFGLMLACVLGLMALGSGLYGGVTRSMTANNAARASLRYLTTSVRAARRGKQPAAGGRAGGRDAGAGGAGQRIRDPDLSVQEQLVEEYAPSGSEPSPENAQPVCACTRFDAQLQQRLLVLTTDQGTARVALRCEKGE